MREKYIDEYVGIWHIFGFHDSEMVDVSDGRKDIFCNLPRSKAELICELQEKFREELYTILEDV